MPNLSGPMLAAASADGLIPFVAVRLTLRSGVVIAWLDASFVATFTANGMTSTFVGEDPIYGVLAAVEDISDGGEDEAPRTRIHINPPTLSAMSALAQSVNQGSKVEIWEGLIDRASGLVVPDPDLAFEGFYDQPSWQPGSLDLTIDCGSIFELFFENEEGVRLNDSFHQSIWPGELGFEYAQEIESRKLPWGQQGVARPITVASKALSSTIVDARYS